MDGEAETCATDTNILIVCFLQRNHYLKRRKL